MILNTSTPPDFSEIETGVSDLVSQMGSLPNFSLSTGCALPSPSEKIPSGIGQCKGSGGGDRSGINPRTLGNRMKKLGIPFGRAMKKNVATWKRADYG